MTTAEPDPCSSEPCKNGGECVSLGLLGIICNCPEGFTGDFCEEVRHINICQNFLKYCRSVSMCCTVNIYIFFNFICQSEEVTTVEPDPCSSEPCKNGGECLALGLLGIMCNCPEGFTGDFCDKVRHINIY